MSIIDLESRRVESHLERLRSRSDLSDAERALLARCAREFETLAERAPASKADASHPAITREGVARHAELLAQLSNLVEKLEGLAQSRYGVDDWRRTAHVDADSILEERRLRNQALGEARGPASL